MRRFLAVDCGSTTTKATLFVEQADGAFLPVARSEVPTTVEAPVEDVTIGVRSALADLERQLGVKLLSPDGVYTVRIDNLGVDGFYATSSAGGGLQMIVAGVMKNLTAESAERAALGAGAIVADVIAIDDGRMPHERLERIYELRPDMVLISGGVDGGNIAHVVQLGELFFSAGIKPRYAPNTRLPVIFAGNKDARKYIADILGPKVDLRIVDNLRPMMEAENNAPARAEIQDAFMNHVMLHAPQYRRLTEWVSQPIVPTPTAVGTALHRLAMERGANILACDIGGATTDVFTVIDGDFQRTVSANLGMSYSINNVLAQAGLSSVLNLIPFPVDEDELQDLLANKMTRPTSIPETPSDLLIEQVMVRLALQLSLRNHQELVTELKGVPRRRTIGDFFDQTPSGQTKLNMLGIDMIIGSGSALSMAPRREQAALMLLDGFQPQGVTDLYVDSQFLLPHIGAIASGEPEVAWNILNNSGSLIHLGTVVAPVGPTVPKLTPLAKVEITGTDFHRTCYIRAGELSLIRLPEPGMYNLVATSSPGYYLGASAGRLVQRKVQASVMGVILDGRGRPLHLPNRAVDRYASLLDAYRSVGAYSDLTIEDFSRRGGIHHG